MTDFFQRLVRGGGRHAAESSQQRLTLAAFGKHPGWDDHIPGIGLETEALSRVKEVLYVGGIGRQIDSGSWEKLDVDKSCEGFDHVFLWLRPNHALLGQLWSSTDGKGRAKYPMVLCVDGEGVSPAFLLGMVRSGLDRLRDACKSSTSAAKVIDDCRVAQEQLRVLLKESSARAAEDAPPIEARRAFLERREFGPDRQGLLRILHELASAPGVAGTGRQSESGVAGKLRSRQLRVPLASESRGQALLLWALFLRGAVPDAVPLLLISRHEVSWLDIIIGDPSAEDFFCLQAAPGALPLATDIPYELGPDLRTRLQQLEATFLGSAPGEIEPSGGLAGPARATTPTLLKETVTSKGPAKSSRWKFFGGGAVLLCTIIGVSLFFGHRNSTRKGPSSAVQAKPSPPITNSAPKPSVANVATQEDRNFAEATNLASLALQRKDYPAASNQAAIALGFKPKDPAATRQMDDAFQGMALTAAARKQQEYEAATNGAATALQRQDYQMAVNQAGLALSLRTNDPIAVRQMQDATAALRQQQDYERATNAATAALRNLDFQSATNQALLALRLRTNDPAALKLMTQAQNGAASAAALLVEQQRKLASLTPSATKATEAPDASPANASFTNSIGMEFVWISGVSGQGAFVGKYEVTQKQFSAAMTALPEGQIVKDDSLPVANVAFAEARLFCETLSKKESKKYFLPSKAEWLALAGLSSEQALKAWEFLRDNGSLSNEVTSLKVGLPLDRPAKGGSRGAQANGLCDLLGNVREWVAEEESAGFSYNSSGGRTKSLFLAGPFRPQDAWIKQATGFRCLYSGQP